MPATFGKQLSEWLPIVGIIIFMIVITILPQRKRNKEVKKMMDEMKKGDWVKTIGGITGKIALIKDDFVTIETGPQHVQITVTKGAIASVGDTDLEAEGLSETDVRVATANKAEKKK